MASPPYSGVLLVKGGTLYTAWTKSFVKLEKGQIRFHKPGKEDTCLGEVDLQNSTYSLEDKISKYPNSFVIRASTGSIFTFAASSGEELNDWIQEIQKDGTCAKLDDSSFPHSLAPKSLRQPTWCKFCEKFIWGIGHPGLICTACGFVFHLECGPKAPANCTKGIKVSTQGEDKSLLTNASPSASKRTIPDNASPSASPSASKRTIPDKTLTLAQKLEKADRNWNQKPFEININSLQIGPELDPSSIKFGKPLGEGAFGKVYSGTLHGVEVAVKKLIQHYGTKDQWDTFIETFRKEVEAMSKANHPNVLLYIGACSTPENELWIIMEKLQIDLENLLLKSTLPMNEITLVQKLKMAKDAASALAFLHSREPQFLHLDLKPANLLMDANGQVKVADFGQTLQKKKDSNNVRAEDFGGTLYYMAPEMLQGLEITDKCDVYSFGIVLYEIIYRKRGFDMKSVPHLLAAVLEKNERPKVEAKIGDDECSDRLRNLMVSCWNKEPAKRPAFLAILQELDTIILEYAIPDPDGRNLWKDNFGKDKLREDVPWKEFIEVFKANYPFPENVAKLGEDCLQAILAHEPVGYLNISKQKLVSLVYFGKVLQWFGPLKGSKHVVEKIISVMKKHYFHGDMDKDEAFAVLKNKALGTFVIRLGHSEPGGFAVSRVLVTEKGKEVRHLRIQYHREKFHFDKQEFDDLDDLVAVTHLKFHLQIPCPGSPFSGLFGDDEASQQNFYEETKEDA